VIPGLHVALGRNTADIKGELGVKDLNLDATIDAPNLDNALPGLAARRRVSEGAWHGRCTAAAGRYHGQ
jgi:autotransporter translocation and assembly factor TamB